MFSVLSPPATPGGACGFRVGSGGGPWQPGACEVTSTGACLGGGQPGAFRGRSPSGYIPSLNRKGNSRKLGSSASALYTCERAVCLCVACVLQCGCECVWPAVWCVSVCGVVCTYACVGWCDGECVRSQGALQTGPRRERPGRCRVTVLVDRLAQEPPGQPGKRGLSLPRRHLPGHLGPASSTPSAQLLPGNPWGCYSCKPQIPALFFDF